MMEVTYKIDDGYDKDDDGDDGDDDGDRDDDGDGNNESKEKVIVFSLMMNKWIRH